MYGAHFVTWFRNGWDISQTFHFLMMNVRNKNWPKRAKSRNVKIFCQEFVAEGLLTLAKLLFEMLYISLIIQVIQVIIFGRMTWMTYASSHSRHLPSHYKKRMTWTLLRVAATAWLWQWVLLRHRCTNTSYTYCCLLMILMIVTKP